MSAPVSVPVVPAQPNQAVYGLHALELFHDFSADPRVKPRDAYVQAFGVPAPNWDPSWPAQYWFDSSVDVSKPDNMAVYESVQNQGAAASIVQVHYPAARAAVVNIPGLNTYPAYVIAPTDAKLGGNPMNPELLSTREDALALAAVLGIPPSKVVETSMGLQVSYPPTEFRRMNAIMYGGTGGFTGIPMFAGELLKQQNAKGVGHSGSWNLTPQGAVWTSTPDGPDGITAGQPTTIVPVPVRPLLENERIQGGLIGSSIVRTDLESTDKVGGFTAADRASLAWIQQKMISLFGN